MSAFAPGALRRAATGLVSVGAGLAIPGYIQPDFLWSSQAACLVCIGVLANVFQPDYKPFEGSTSEQDHGTAAQILWSIQLTQLGAFLEVVLLRWPEAMTWDLVAWVALGAVLLGLVVRSWAVATLGRFFTWNVEVQEGQGVIRQGPYRFVRHPSYTGAFLTYVGIPIFLHAWYSAGAALVLLPLAFYRRIHHEEKLLSATLDGYEDFRREVPALFPRPF